MFMRFLITVFAIFLIFIYLLNCKDSGTDPPVNGKIDTTSHDFVWRIDTIGINRSYLLDVAVIDENNIWAVGEINTEDTGIPDSNGIIHPPYNAIHWDGIEWNLIRIKEKLNDLILPISVLRGIKVISESDIWLASGSILYYDGEYATIAYKREYIQESARGFWGISESNIYCYGDNGMLVHYNGTSWHRIPSGTELDINDIWGTKNEKTGEWEIYAVASDIGRRTGRKILKVNSTVQSVSTDSLPDDISSIWFIPGERYYVCGDGLYETSSFSKYWNRVPNQIDYFYKTKIRGNASNDIFVVGSFGLFSHFNGYTWHHYTDNELVSFNGSYTSLYVNQNDIVVVGGDHVSALVVRGTRIAQGD